jgi:hypothetical protein
VEVQVGFFRVYVGGASRNSIGGIYYGLTGSLIMKRRGREDPLLKSIRDVVTCVCDWEDPCGGKYTVDTETIVGIDYAELRIRGVQDARATDIKTLVEGASHIHR